MYLHNFSAIIFLILTPPVLILIHSQIHYFSFKIAIVVHININKCMNKVLYVKPENWLNV